MFSVDKKISNIDHIIDLEKAMHQVGPGTGRDVEFGDAIELNEVEGSYILSYETDGSIDPQTAFNRAMQELNARFDNLSKEIADAL